MTDDPEYTLTIAGLKLSEAYDRLMAKVPFDAPCPMCANRKWLVEGRQGLSGATPTPLFIMKDTRSYFGSAPAMANVALSCSNCGFVRLHNVAVLMRE